jgi:hypothetical protein
VEYQFTVTIVAHDPRDDAADRIRREIDRHLSVIFNDQYKGVTSGHPDQTSAR